MEKKHEKSSDLGVGVATVAAVGLFLMGLTVGHGIADGDGRVERVQTYYQQLHDQLDGSYDHLDKLVLNDSAKSFMVTVSSEGQPTRECKGKYTIDQIARATGDIACTVTGPLPTQTTINTVTTR